MHNQDVVIVGGGLAGAVLACCIGPSLFRAGRRVCLVERFDPDALSQPLPGSSFDGRATALSPSGVAVLEHAGLWRKLSKYAQPILNIHVSERGRFGATRLSAAEERVDALGYVVENATFGALLWQQLACTPGVQIQSPAEVLDIRPAQDGVTLRIRDGSGEETGIQPALCVLADGGQSDLAMRLGVNATTQACEQTAIIATLGLDQDHAGWAWERFAEEGPMALLPLTHQRAALVWTLSPDRARTIAGLPDEAFLAAAQQAFGDRAGDFVRTGRRWSHSLQTRWVEDQVRPGLVLLGNSAHVLHPVAGQGFNLTLRDIARLAAALKRDDASFGSLAQLAAYARESRSDQLQVMDACDGLVRGFTSRLPGVYSARTLGLVGLSLVGPARHWLARRAMGMTPAGGAQ